MRLFAWLWAILMIAVKRLYAQKGLTLATLLGLVVTIGLVLSIPLYADAVYFRVLREELTKDILPTAETAPQTPLTFLFRYVGSLPGPVSWDDAQPVDTYLTGPGQDELDLPQLQYIRHIKTENFRLFPSDETNYTNSNNALAWVKFGFISDMAQQIELIEGRLPVVAEPTPESTMEVLVHETLVTQLGLQVGERYSSFNRQNTDIGSRTTQIPLHIVGVWRTAEVAQPFWSNAPGNVDELFLVPEDTFLGRISPYMEDDVNLALWYMVLDGSQVRTPDAGPLLTRITATRQQVSGLLPDSDLNISPVEALQEYQQAAGQLTILLYAFSAPILALILTFISLVVGLAVSRQRNEIAVLRSRGGTTGQIIAIAALESLLLSVIGLALGLPLAINLAKIMGRTQSFLNFSGQTDLTVTVTWPTLQVGLVAVAVVMVAQIIPSFGAARHTIVTYKQDRARTLRAPWWQRSGLDILLLIPAGYGTYLLQQQGSIVLPGSDALSNSDPFQNPLLLLVPALGIFALTLLFLRLLPLVMASLAWLSARLGGLSFLLATRQLARTPGFYTAPMILLVLTLSLSAFTASLAQTLDNHLFDQTYYQFGADISLIDWGQGAGNPEADSFATFLGSDDEPASDGERETPSARFLFLPISEYLKAPGVQAVTRVAEYAATTELSGGSQTGTFIGVDWSNFPGIAFWRLDFAPAYLTELMNALALTPDGVLLPETFIRQHALQVGDTIQVNVEVYGETIPIALKVAGGFHLFPTWYPEEGPLYVANLDHFFEQLGGQYPYQVWLRTEPQADYGQISAALRGSNLQVLSFEAPLVQVAEAQRNPERQGLFGLLSVGFGAAALLTVLGFILYAFFSFRQRFIELGVLRAIGLSSPQMTLFLAWELAFLILTGLTLGTFLGAWASQLFIPFLQVGAEAAARTPPFLVEIAWPAIFRIYLLFGLLFIAALSVLVGLLLRMKIFQAIKLGETL